MKKIYTDQMNRSIEIPFPPKRIVSLVPSQTELLYDLGLTDEVVGQTLFCIHPAAMHKSKPRVGGTKNASLEKIDALKPDLIIGNKEENDKETIEKLAQKYPVWMSDINSINDALDMIKSIGIITDTQPKAHEIINSITKGFSNISQSNEPKSVAYFIWKNPWMLAGHQTFIHEVLKVAGFKNVLKSNYVRYPELSQVDLEILQPDIVFLSSEPYPFKEKHIPELLAIFPHAKIILVDGEMFSWYGSRLIHTCKYIESLL